MFWRFARQHNATLWFEKLFTTTNKIQAEKTVGSGKGCRMVLPTSGSPFLLLPAFAAKRPLLPPSFDHSAGGSKRPSFPTAGPVPWEKDDRKTQTHVHQYSRGARSGAVHPPGFPVKTGVHIHPVIVGISAYMGSKHSVRVKIGGDIKVQFPITLCNLIGEGHRIYRQPFGTPLELRGDSPRSKSSCA